MPRSAAAFVAGLVVTACLPGSPAAQSITTGALSGTVRDPLDAVLPGASVTVVLGQTGARYDTVADAAGHFQIRAVPAGGPYTVSASLPGFTDESLSGVVVALGETREVTLRLRLASVRETVTVAASVASEFDGTRAGTAANIAPDVVGAIPTIQRSIIDIAQTSAFVNPFSPNGGDATFSIAGRNNRYNVTQIDGAVNNDLFGASTTGFPGGPAGPISLDAVGELQLVVTPYDVRQGNFAAGGVNLVTRAGGNEVSGTGYMLGRTEGLVGAIPNVLDRSKDTRVGAFSDYLGGFSLGGPFVRNRAFFFGNVEIARRAAPSGFSVSGDSGQPWGSRANVDLALAIMQGRYGRDPGSLDQSTKHTDSEKYLLRTDVALGADSRLTARFNDVDLRGTVGTPSSSLYLMPEAYSRLSDSTLTAVAQFTTAGRRALNELRVAWQRGRNERSDQPGQRPFPSVRVDFTDGRSLLLGSDPIANANNINQDIIEFTDDITWTAGRHTLTGGAHLRLAHFENRFIQNSYGSYRFSSIDNLQAGLAQAFSRTFSNTGDPRQAAAFSVSTVGLYVGDQWRARDHLTLTYGLRVDVPWFHDEPRANPLVLAEFGYATDFMPSPVAWSPRAGFTWASRRPGGSQSQLRGGIGVFSGQPPYVWMSNAFANTGVDFTTVTIPLNPANRIPFVADPFDQPANLAGAGRQTISVVDPGFRFPSVLQGNLAYERSLGPWGLIGMAELLVSGNLNDVTYANLNYVAVGTQPDGRLTYTKLDPSLNDVILLSTTSAGHQWTAVGTVKRPKGPVHVEVSYLLNRSRSVSDGTSNIAASSWALTYTSHDVNAPPVTRSIYDVGQRIMAMAIVPVPLPTRLTSVASVYYSGQPGQPYVLVFNGDANGDGRPNNDIVFAPGDPGQVVLVGGTWAQLDQYLGNDSSTAGFRGRIPPRNSGRAPWHHTLNARYLVSVPTGGRTKVELTMDVTNVLNLLSKRWGAVYYPSQNGPLTIGWGGIDRVTGKEVLNLSTITAPTFAGTFNRDDLRSRWQAQWGVRVRF